MNPMTIEERRAKATAILARLGEIQQALAPADAARLEAEAQTAKSASVERAQVLVNPVLAEYEVSLTMPAKLYQSQAIIHVDDDGLDLAATYPAACAVILSKFGLTATGTAKPANRAAIIGRSGANARKASPGDILMAFRGVFAAPGSAPDAKSGLIEPDAKNPNKFGNFETGSYIGTDTPERIGDALRRAGLIGKTPLDGVVLNTHGALDLYSAAPVAGSEKQLSGRYELPKEIQGKLAQMRELYDAAE